MSVASMTTALKAAPADGTVTVTIDGVDHNMTVEELASALFDVQLDADTVWDAVDEALMMNLHRRASDFLPPNGRKPVVDLFMARVSAARRAG